MTGFYVMTSGFVDGLRAKGDKDVELDKIEQTGAGRRVKEWKF
jgi:hypothetical protein